MQANHTSPKANSHFWNNKYRFYYIILFIIFGVIIAFFTSAVNYSLEIADIKKNVKQDAEAGLAHKRQQISSFTHDLEEFVAALRDSDLLVEYIRSPTEKTKHTMLKLMSAMVTAESSVMQLRYLNSSGIEKLRIDQDYGQESPVIIANDQLQDKSHRYYFQESARLAPSSFWYSNLDLNVEHNQIEVPYRPVFRIASPVYLDGQFEGIVILNAHTTPFLNLLSNSNMFDISLVDKDGYYITNYNQGYSWSRYLESGHTLQKYLPHAAERILTESTSHTIKNFSGLYTASVASLLPKDGAILLFEPKVDKIHTLEAERQKAAFYIILIILLLSLPLSFLISRTPARLYQEVTRKNAVLTEYFELIDNNILSCVTDREGSFVDCSTAFAERTGYSREELARNTYAALHHPDGDPAVFKEIWQEITQGKIWQGEIQHLTRSGEHYWTEAIIYPKRDSSGKIEVCSAIHQDITNRKRIEQLSVTDELTGLFNRRFFNTTIVRELNRAQREHILLSFAMLDVDFFKQYNDHYGHQKGDDVLATIGHCLKNKLGRGSDSYFRLGGEEFGVIMVNLTPEEAFSFVEEIRVDIETIGIEHRGSRAAEVITVSAGLLSVSPGPGITVDTVYRKADEALYAAKEQGRNRVVSSSVLTHSA